MRPSSRQPYLTLLPLGVVLVLAVVGWNILKSLPSRYQARLPEFIQAWVAPGPESPILPAPATTVDASALLAATAVTSPTPTIPPTPAASATVAPTATPSPTPIPTPAPSPTPLPTSIRLEGFTHQAQDWNNCGPATLAMALTYFNLNYTQTETAAFLKPNPEDRNVSPDEMAAFVNSQTTDRALVRVNGSLDLLKQLLLHGFPSIIEVGLDPPGEVAWLEWYGHYLLAVGYDDAAQELWVFDSLVWDAASLAEQNSPFGRPYPYADLTQYWPQFNNTYIVFYPPEREEELAALLGDDMNDQQMWEAALAQAEADLQRDNQNAFAWFNLGSAYTALGQYDKAATAYDQARTIGLPWRMLWYQFGPYEAYYQVGRYVDVILLANTTLDNKPYFEESYYYRGLAQLALGDKANAQANFEAAIAFNPYYTPASQALSALNP